jgi:hypothetical protein
MNNIEIYDPTYDFLTGQYVFKITVQFLDCIEKDIYMVTQLEDVNKKLSLHLYNPLLYAVPFTTRLSYLYGCLNLSYNNKRKENYIFWIRKVNTLVWTKWFTVKPYVDCPQS